VHPAALHAYETEMASARTARREGDLAQAFHHLERAHVLAQRSTLRHARAHWSMLSAGFAQHDVREVIGQMQRLVAALLFSRIWIPLGNTGRARVSATAPMPVPDDLRFLIS
jgi:hypothetical protein